MPINKMNLSLFQNYNSIKKGGTTNAVWSTIPTLYSTLYSNSPWSIFNRYGWSIFNRRQHLTFKENCPDLRNSKVADVVHELQNFGWDVSVHDPVAESEEAVHEYGISLMNWDNLPAADAIVAAVSHNEYLETPPNNLLSKLNPGGVFVDVKSAYDPVSIQAAGYKLWRL